MFTCATCQKSVGPKVSPIRIVVHSRVRTYENETADGIKQSIGGEIEREENICPKCLGQDVRTQVVKVDHPLQDEPLAPGYKLSMAALALGNSMDRSKHNTKRGANDFKAAYEHLSGFANRGGGLK